MGLEKREGEREGRVCPRHGFIGFEKMETVVDKTELSMLLKMETTVFESHLNRSPHA